MFGSAFLCAGLLLAFAVAADLRLDRCAGASDAARLARDLWHRGMGLFVAAASVLLGQEKLLLALLRGSPLQFLPLFLPLVALGFWLVRIRLGRTFGKFREGRVTSPANLKAA